MKTKKQSSKSVKKTSKKKVTKKKKNTGVSRTKVRFITKKDEEIDKFIPVHQSLLPKVEEGSSFDWEQADGVTGRKKKSANPIARKKLTSREMDNIFGGYSDDVPLDYDENDAY